MNQDRQMLVGIQKATDMGRQGIETVLRYAAQPQFRGALHAQLHEYQQIEAEAKRLLRSRGMREASGLAVPAAMAQMMSRAKLARDSSQPAIAAMMIEGNTKGMIQSMRSNHALQVTDPKISNLSNRLLQTELANIEQMKGFL